MPTPRITGLLNNCALSCALPMVLNGIHEMALREANGTLGAILHNPVVEHYVKLKTIFAREYGVQNHPCFDWRAFETFLSQHSFYAQEILFAPVVRAFVAEVGLESGAYRPGDLGGLQDLQDGSGEENLGGEVIPQGRYHMLTVEDAFDLFYRPFGLRLGAYDHVPGDSTDQYEPHINPRLQADSDPSVVYPFGQAPRFELYLKHGHFEIQPHGALAVANQAFIKEIDALPKALAEIHEGLSTSLTAAASRRQLDRLKAYGSEALLRQLTAAERDQTAALLSEVVKSLVLKALVAYRKTNEVIYIEVVDASKAIATAPTLAAIENYSNLRERVSQKGHWGHIIAGVMLSVISLALMIVSSLSLVASFGHAAPISLPVLALGTAGLALGVGLFRRGRTGGASEERKDQSPERTPGIKS
ncbi:MAG: hypothetical protein NTW94_07250 [Legionellales bacterium]|nr:hypothetical protein [Legionellales bacterium]